jgi:signal peptidase II
MLIAVIAFALFGLDRISKLFAEGLDGRIEVLGDFIVLCTIRNEGLCFGLFSGYGALIFWLTAILVVFLIGYSVFVKDKSRRFQVGVGLFIGGALGNLVDRPFGGVIDFISIGIGDLRWPTFNIADIGIVAGAILLVLRRKDASNTD